MASSGSDGRPLHPGMQHISHLQMQQPPQQHHGQIQMQHHGGPMQLPGGPMPGPGGQSVMHVPAGPRFQMTKAASIPHAQPVSTFANLSGGSGRLPAPQMQMSQPVRVIQQNVFHQQQQQQQQPGTTLGLGQQVISADGHLMQTGSLEQTRPITTSYAQSGGVPFSTFQLEPSASQQAVFNAANRGQMGQPQLVATTTSGATICLLPPSVGSDPQTLRILSQSGSMVRNHAQQQQQQQHFPRSGNLVDRHSLSPKQMKGGLPPHSVEPSSSSSHQSQHVAHQPTSRYSHLPPPSSSPTAYLPSPQQQQHLPPVSGGRGSNFSQSTDNSAVLGGAASGLQNAAVSAALHERMFAAAKAAFANANLSGDCASDSSKALTVATLAAAAVAEVVAQENQIHQQQQQQQLQRYFRSAGPPFCPLPSVSASQPPSLGSMSMSNGAGAGGNNSTGAAAAAAMFAHLQQHFQQQQQQQQKRQYPGAVPCSSSALLHGGGYPGGGQPHHQSSPISPQPQPPQSNKRASQTRMEHPPPPSSQQQQHHHHLSSQHLQHPPRLAHSGGAHSSNASAGGSGGPYRQSTPHTQTLDLLAAAAAAATNPALMTAAGVGAYPGSSLAAAVPSPSSSTAAAAAAAAAAAISAAQLTNLHPQQLSALFPGGLPMRDAAGTLAMMNAAAAAAIAATSRNAQISSSPTGPSMAGVCGGGGGSLAQVANQAAVADYLRFLSQLSAAGLSLPHSGSGGGGPGGGAGFSQQSSTR
uniref:Uncharacterized protein n=1 Tax=Schistocephalus solidus TaxID=70667 RepID=A0A0X3PAV9_SCHSO